MNVVGLINDLMFSTRLRDAARDLGHDCRVVRRAADVTGALEGVDVLVVDLMLPGGGALAAVTAAREAGVTVLAYGEHVRADVLDAAREAGADQVLTNREFASRLPVLLGATSRRR